MEIPVDELEALRLCDLEERSQKDAASEMNISRGTLQRLHIVADLGMVTCNLSSKVIRLTELPAGVPQVCKWERVDMGLLYLVLILPSCLTLLVACTITFLTFRKPLLQVIKSRCHWSSIY